MSTEKQRPMVVSVGVYLVQFVAVVLIVIHNYATKDAEIVVSLLVAMYGMNLAHSSTESVVSGLRFLSLMKPLGSRSDEHSISAEMEALTQEEAPYTFAHALFGFLIAAIVAAKLLYALFIE
jgi:hypothetical protein